ncbi:aldehyde dehydrogenase family protein [Marinomonas sp. KJ51-3]|uniref:Aldehyde dehydrogenase family protein n=1 Tax=Marinomonas rhodophyticola TaxID=2992803 RepID=A0ABT3KMQ0_9GAMM|nr:aldehyde dehydrogenase family protein [Marinomonas sp. KJ51-3]MCW4631654.1 aldehyde dehydrogenase family protein [Marinomonas sp. KJ51-3]
MATDRIIVEQAIADDFIKVLKSMVTDLVSGNPRHKHVKLGPVASASIAARLSALIEDALDKGQHKSLGLLDRGQFIDATLLDHITPMMRIYSEECFGHCWYLSSRFPRRSDNCSQ